MKWMLMMSLCLALPAMARTGTQGVDAVLKARERPNAPGCAVALARSGEGLVLKAYGMANLEHRIAIDPARSVFNIASLSKQFTAASILLLEQDGKLARSDDIRRFLPGLPDFGHKITVEHLLHHTSGLRDYVGMAMIGERHPSDYTDNDAIMAFIQRQQGLDFAPGSEHLYSNTGYFLLARIIERASGKDYGGFLKDRLFAPLAMQDTFVLTEQGSLMPGRTSGYLPRDGGGWNTAIGGWIETGARGVYTTAADLAKWQANFSTLQLGGKALRTALLQQGRLDDGTVIDYAGGVRVGQFQNMPTVEHGGADQGFRAEMLHLPTAGLSVTVLCNDMAADPAELARAVLRNYLPPVAAKKQATKPAPIASPAPISPEFAGRYWARQRGLVRQVVLEDSKLWYVRSPRSRSPLQPLGGARFQVGGMEDGTNLAFSQSGGRTRMQLLAPLSKAIDFESVTPPVLVRPDEFAGTFVSREYDTRWIVSPGKDGLTMRSFREPEADARKFEPLADDAFHGPGMVVRFVRDGAGKVQSLEVDTSRSRNVVFKKI